MLVFFGQGAVIGFSAGVTPGPLLAYFLGQSTRHGWRKTLPAAFSPLISDGPIILLVLVLLAQVPEAVLDALGLIGGLFLLYIAWRTVNQARNPTDSPAESATPDRPLWTAALVNLLNPNPYIFWGTVLGPRLVLLWRQQPAFGAAFAAGFYVAMIGVFAAWILFAGLIAAAGDRFRQGFSYLSAAGLAGYGMFQIAAVLGL